MQNGVVDFCNFSKLHVVLKLMYINVRLLSLLLKFEGVADTYGLQEAFERLFSLSSARPRGMVSYW